VPALDDDSRVKYIIGSSVNITERKRAEDASDDVHYSGNPQSQNQFNLSV
jgi:hypothetical protein